MELPYSQVELHLSRQLGIVKLSRVIINSELSPGDNLRLVTADMLSTAVKGH